MVMKKNFIIINIIPAVIVQSWNAENVKIVPKQNLPNLTNPNPI